MKSSLLKDLHEATRRASLSLRNQDITFEAVQHHIRERGTPFHVVDARAIVVDFGEQPQAECVCIHMGSISGYRTGLALLSLIEGFADRIPVAVRLLFTDGCETDGLTDVLSGVTKFVEVREDAILEPGTIGVNFGAFAPTIFRFDVTVMAADGLQRKSRVDILAAAQIILSLREALSRRIDPLRPFELTFNGLTGGPGEHVVLAGIFRSTDHLQEEKLRQLLEDCLADLTAGHGAKCDLRLHREARGVSTDSDLATYLLAQGRELFDRLVVRLEFVGSHASVPPATPLQTSVAALHLGTSPLLTPKPDDDRVAELPLRCAALLTLALLRQHSPDLTVR